LRHRIVSIGFPESKLDGKNLVEDSVGITVGELLKIFLIRRGHLPTAEDDSAVPRISEPFNAGEFRDPWGGQLVGEICGEDLGLPEGLPLALGPIAIQGIKAARGEQQNRAEDEGDLETELALEVR
jgi:hypothetical protein